MLREMGPNENRGRERNRERTTDLLARNEAGAEAAELRSCSGQRQEERHGRVRQRDKPVVEIERQGGPVLGFYGHGEDGDLGTGGAVQGVGQQGAADSLATEGLIHRQASHPKPHGTRVLSLTPLELIDRLAAQLVHHLAVAEVAPSS
jgi:hypothetical protein